jgi:spoIIIJ-associated protein
MELDLEPRVIEFANSLLQEGGFDLEASAVADPDGFRVNIAGDDLAVLLGRKAELLDALEYVCNRVFTTGSGPEPRIVFDAENYRARRERELRLMAEKAAEKVRASRIPFTFEPMSPNERRIIHLALGEDQTVKTESRGNGIDRKVMIYPAS